MQGQISSNVGPVNFKRLLQPDVILEMYKQHCREHPLDRSFWSRASQEFCDFIKNGVLIAYERQMVVPVQFYIFGTWNKQCDKPAALHRQADIPFAMDDQRRNAQGGEYVAYVDFRIHPR